MTQVEVRPIDKTTLATHYRKELGQSVKAWAGFVDGRIIAVGGVAYARGILVAFVQSSVLEKLSSGPKKHHALGLRQPVVHHFGR